MNQAAAVVPSFSPDAPCPCGSGRNFGQCCGPILKQERRAATAEELMRSRFTAHVLRDEAHLHRTFLGTAGQPYRPAAESDGEPLTWTRLSVHSHETSAAKPDLAFVDFSAFYRDGEVERAIHEKSEFQRIGGEWFYTRTLRDGPAPVKAAHPKVGRNDPCPCGSGKKYKQCCLGRA